MFHSLERVFHGKGTDDAEVGWRSAAEQRPAGYQEERGAKRALHAVESANLAHRRWTPFPLPSADGAATRGFAEHGPQVGPGTPAPMMATSLIGLEP